MSATRRNTYDGVSSCKGKSKGGKDTAGGKETQLTQLSTSGEREQLARFAAAGAHVGLRATGIPAVAAARLEALALARTAADASRNGAG